MCRILKLVPPLVVEMFAFISTVEYPRLPVAEYAEVPSVAFVTSLYVLFLVPALATIVDAENDPTSMEMEGAVLNLPVEPT